MVVPILFMSNGVLAIVIIAIGITVVMPVTVGSKFVRVGLAPCGTVGVITMLYSTMSADG